MAKRKRDGALSAEDLATVADWIKAEKERRAQHPRRREMERIWKEIDRQISMTPVALAVPASPTRTKEDWYPELEIPWQFNTLEVVSADARRLKFPRGSKWYTARANLSDTYMQRFDKRRFAGTPLAPQLGVTGPAQPMVGETPVPMKIDQETADILVHAAIDHYHSLYNFRGAMDLLDGEAIKYGTCVGRVRKVRIPKIMQEYRVGRPVENQGPALLPASIKYTYLDHSAALVMHEGEMVAPSFIAQSWQVLEDLKQASVIGGKERGWFPATVADLVPSENPSDRKGLVEVLEFEGDLIVPSSGSDSIFVPNARIKIAVGGNGAKTIRLQINDDPFPTWVVGYYMRDSVDWPYGVSPLMKGQPIAEAGAAALNDMMAVSAIKAGPPVAYDRNDPTLTASGGPAIAPRAVWATDSPNAIEVHHEIGDLQAAVQLYLALKKEYEDTTGVNDPRRGAEIKSHTTATQVDIESTKGLSRTDDFVIEMCQGFLVTVLNMQYQIAKEVLSKPASVLVDANGMERFINLAAADLPDEVAFEVSGAAGVLQEREAAANFMAATNMVNQLAAAAAQLSGLGLPVKELPIPDFVAQAMEIYGRAGIQNPNRFVSGQPSVPAGVTPAASIPGTPSGALGMPTPSRAEISAIRQP